MSSFFGFLNLIAGTQESKSTPIGISSSWDENTSHLGVPAWFQGTYRISFAKEKSVIQSSDIQNLISTLVDFWIESSESVFSKTDVLYSPHLAICGLTISILKKICLSFRHAVTDKLPLVIQHIHPKFPFGQNISCNDQKSLEVMNRMNCEYSIVSLMMGSELKRPSYWDPVFDFTVNYLASTTMSDHSSMLDVVLELSLVLDSSRKKRLLKHLLQFEDKKATLVTFQMVVSVIQNLNAGNETVTKDWVLKLPKRLYQLKNKNPPFSEEILLFLIHFLSRLKVELEQEFLDSLQDNLSPLFFAVLQRGHIPGPVVHYEFNLQSKALNLLYYLNTWSDKLVRAICYCCQQTQVGAASVHQVLDLATSRQETTEKLNWNLYYSFRLSCIIGASQLEFDSFATAQAGPTGSVILRQYEKVSLSNQKYVQRYTKMQAMKMNFCREELVHYQPVLISLLAKPIPTATALLLLSMNTLLEDPSLTAKLSLVLIDLVNELVPEHMTTIHGYLNRSNTIQFLQHTLSWAKQSPTSIIY
jgi:hypothetical protein